MILTGAAAGSLLGHIRPSLDIDFSIELIGRSKKKWQKAELAIAQAQKVTGIHVNYAQDIDRWGSISLLDYRKHIRPYRSFGKLQVTLLDPAYWTIGKMTRFLDSDIQDIAEVISKEGIPSGKLVRLWAKALRTSPLSTASFQFRQHVERFLRQYGKSIWGKRFNPEFSIRLFQVETGISYRERYPLSSGAKFAVMGEGDTVILKKIAAPPLSEIRRLFQESRQYARRVGLKPSDIKRAIQRVRRSSR